MTQSFLVALRRVLSMLPPTRAARLDGRAAPRHRGTPARFSPSRVVAYRVALFSAAAFLIVVIAILAL